MTLQRLTPGDKFHASARTWNRFADSTERSERALNGNRVGESILVAAGAVIDVENNSGATREAGHILGLGTPLMTPSSNPQAFQFATAIAGATPTDASHKGKWVILLESLVDKQVGPGLLFGVIWVKVDITDTNHNFATLKNSDATQLKSAAFGEARILSQESGTGTKWCLVRLGDYGGLEFHRGVTDAAINKGASGTVSRYTEGTTTDSGINDTVTNEIANIGSGKKCYYIRSGANLYMTTGECPLT